MDKWIEGMEGLNIEYEEQPERIDMGGVIMDKEKKALLENSTWLSTGEVARALGVNVQTARKWMREGTIERTQLPGGHYRCHIDTIKKIIEDGSLKGRKKKNE